MEWIQVFVKQILFDDSIYDIADTNEIFMKRLDTIKPKKIIALDRRFLGAEKINLSSLQRKKKKDKRLWDKNQVPIHFKQSFITLGGTYSRIPGVKSNYIFPKQDNISTRIGNEGNEFNLDLSLRLKKMYYIGISFITGVSFFNYQIEQEIASTSF